ncbi:lantibiotic immunity ABC transporter MutE/EpiE family permease subunit [Bariatricus sp. SGI.154]|uniref:lantibiotic immunity ABC transporter MutE/EpiE family permease subunit n=1 Tax=Bariatricus sp. SGI.154 TaxID=3420549 RepID=UPI003D04F649
MLSGRTKTGHLKAGCYYKAERLKNQRTAAGKIMIIMPLFSVLLSAWLTHGYFAIDSYNWWYITLFPGMMALVCGMTGNRDKKMGNRTIWALPVDMGRIWDAKILYCIQATATAVFLMLAATVLLGIGMEKGLHITFLVKPTLEQQVAAAILLFVTALWQIPFCMLLQQLIGIFPMVLLHIGSYILAACSISLKPYFMLFSGAITARLMCAVIRVLPNGLPAVPGNMTYSPELVSMKSLPAGVAVSLVWFLVLWMVSRRWFERQVPGR